MQNGAIFSRVVQESTKRDVVDEKLGNHGEGTEKSCLFLSWVSRAPSLLCARLKNAKK